METTFESQMKAYNESLKKAMAQKETADGIEKLAGSLDLLRFVTISNRSSVRIGNEKFTATIDNNKGSDGTSFVIVDEENKIDTSKMFFRSSIHCEEVKIYMSDGEGDEYLHSLTGDYIVYALYGVIVFQPIK